METPRATIVIPLLRQPDGWLERCVRSAVEQTVPVDVIVVTSAQTPRSNQRVLQQLFAVRPELTVLEEGEPGFAGGLNSGIGASATERVGFLLADDWLHPTAVEKCLNHAADIVCTQVAMYAADGKTALGIEQRTTVQVYKQKETDHARASYLSHFFLFAKRALLEVGGVDPTIGNTGADDYDLIWTLLENGASVRIVEEILYFMRDHHGEMRLTLRNREEQIADLEKIFDKHRVHGDLRERLIDRHARWYGRPIHEVIRETRESD